MTEPPPLHPNDPSGPVPTRTLLGLPRPTVLGALGVGLGYGLLARLVFGMEAFGGAGAVMSLTFIFVVPIVVGFATVYTLPERGGWKQWISTPMLTALLTVGAAMLLAWEGLICIVVWLPVFLILAAVGGIIAGVVRGAGDRRHPMVLAAVAAVPFLLAPGERALPTPVRTHVVEDVVVIDADAATVWREIREVPPIAASELGAGFIYRIGFPRPIEARLVGTGVGSVRHATFEGGVTFVETVTEWVPGRALAFTIDADAVPSRTFDTHVAVGGPFFDVLDGRYEIEPLAPGRVALHLSSTHRLQTRFNGYTRLWTDRFMRDIQQGILDVIKARSERAAARP